MSKHDKNFKKGTKEMDKAIAALDRGEVLESFKHARKGIVRPIAGVMKDPVGFARELITDYLKP